MARTKSVVLRLSEEEYNLLKELSGREPMNAYLRRVALAEPNAATFLLKTDKRVPKDVVLIQRAEGAQGPSGAKPQGPSPSEPQWNQAKAIPSEAFDWFKCPVTGCEFRARSSVARCPDHGRTVIMG